MELLQPVKADLFPRAVRRPLRAMLHRAARGDAVAYQILMERYFDLILESLVLSDLAPPEALARTKTLLREGWQRLPYLKRLSDWERFLALSLLSIEPASDSTSCEIRQNLFKLKPEARFALIAFEFENWELPWLALALRIQPRELNQLLLETRCRLLNIDLDQTSKETRRSFNIFFANLNGRAGSARQRKTTHLLCNCSETRNLKSKWLDLRCSLIEIRQQIRPQPEEKKQLLNEIAGDLPAEPMLRPSLTSRIRNMISFDDLPLSQTSTQDRQLHFGE